MTHEKDKALSPTKALTLSEAVQLLRAKADAAMAQAISAMSNSSKSVAGKWSKWRQEG